MRMPRGAFAWAIEDVFSFFPIKAEYDHVYLRGAFSGLRSEVVKLGCAPPVFAASSLFGPTSDVIVPKDPVASRRCLTVNVLPLDSATSAVFSWLPAHQEFADCKLSGLRSLTDCETSPALDLKRSDQELREFCNEAVALRVIPTRATVRDSVVLHRGHRCPGKRQRLARPGCLCSRVTSGWQFAALQAQKIYLLCARRFAMHSARVPGWRRLLATPSSGGPTR